jgi:hypothetical protein
MPKVNASSHGLTIILDVIGNIPGDHEQHAFIVRTRINSYPQRLRALYTP